MTPVLELTAPGSKSATLRALVAAAFASGESRIRGGLDCDDVSRMRAALTALGAVSEDEEGGEIRVGGTAGKLRPGPLTLDAGESGAVLRFLLAVIAAAGRGSYRLAVHGRLGERPTGEMDAVLGALGATLRRPSRDVVEIDAAPRSVGILELGALRSGQTVSALLLAAPLLASPPRVVLAQNGPAEPPSAGYVELTCQVLRAFGVTVERHGRAWRIAADAGYVAADFDVEGDWSSAGYLLAGAAMRGRALALGGLAPSSAQPDRKVVQLLAETGVKVVWDGGRIRVSGCSERAFQRDFDACPDFAPTAAVLAATLGGTSVLSGLGRLADKESNRFEALARGLAAAGITVTVGKGELRVTGGRLHPARLDGAGDHRIVMSLALLSLIEPGIEVSDPEAVTKSYPGFFADLARIAGG